ncbi:rNA polymerase sigma factor [Clostridium sp. CAG:1000]|nr:RNA polymerase sporulation sigma factor SigK [Clostridium sp.]CCX36095.1 rNA polymerase sigma factor [Clostridium sp. CAG:1000]
MLNKIINYLKKIKIFTTSYSLNVFDSPLSKEDEQMYIERHLKGDKDARNKLIEHNLRLVAHIVKKYESKGNTDDLISIGTIGLIKGIDSYRPQKKVKLTTYAAKCAENEILMYFRSNKKYNNNISLNDVIGHDKDGGDITLIDVLKEETESPIKTIEYNDNIAHLSKYLTVLNKRELEIIKMRYGLLNTSEKTQKEIAKKLGISRSYVSRIEKRALIKMLREFIKNNN